jgi:hypothetical protein
MRRIKLTLITLLPLVGFVLGAGCSESSDGGGAGGAGGGGAGTAGVGSPCTADDQCGGFDNAICVDEIQPLIDLVEDTGDPANTALRDLTLPFPGGYCGTSLDTPCATDAECGNGGCFRPFEGVSDASIQNLDALGLPFAVSEFAQTGTCLLPCTSDADCRQDEGYQCLVPIGDLIAVVNQDYRRTFCVQYVDSSYLLN